MSDAKERLFVVYSAYKDAYQRRASDLKQATSNSMADSILRNVEKLEGHYLKAANAALEANGQAVEAAYKAAKDARETVENAYKGAKALAEKIRLVGQLAQAVGKLITITSKK